MRGLLQDKVSLITGGGSGIGRAAAKVFAREGAKVIIADVNVKGGQETLQMVRKAGGDAIFIETDVSKAAEVEMAVIKTVETYGRLDCAFNNAGIDYAGTVTNCTEEEWDRVMAINLKGVWLCLKFEIRHMLRHGVGGAIVNMASIYGIIARSQSPIYTASKHGIVGLTKAAALEYAKENVRVNALCPGPIRTPLTLDMWKDLPQAEEKAASRVPMGRLGKEEEVAEAAAWLCSDRASYITGHTLVVDGGMVAGSR